MSEPRQPGGKLIVYQSDDGRVRLDVRLHQETVWLTQALMAELFQTSQQNISQHIAAFTMILNCSGRQPTRNSCQLPARVSARSAGNGIITTWT